MVITALAAANHDPNTWDHPERFVPERFLGTNGRLNGKQDHSLPFGAGKRLCAGETFARNTLFLFIAALFQNFSVEAPPDATIPGFDQNATALARSPPDFWVKLVPR